MNKSEPVSRVAAETSLPRAAADRTVSTLFSVIADALADGETVTIAGFGTFAARSRAARQGRNPSTGEPVAIAASRAPSFKPGRTLRDTANSTPS